MPSPGASISSSRSFFPIPPLRRARVPARPSWRATPVPRRGNAGRRGPSSAMRKDEARRAERTKSRVARAARAAKSRFVDAPIQRDGSGGRARNAGRRRARGVTSGSVAADSRRRRPRRVERALSGDLDVSGALGGPARETAALSGGRRNFSRESLGSRSVSIRARHRPLVALEPPREDGVERRSGPPRRPPATAGGRCRGTRRCRRDPRARGCRPSSP